MTPAKKINKILAIAHRSDLDGLACHAIIRKYGEINGLAVEHFFVDYPERDKTFLDLADAGMRENEIIVADIGGDKELLPIYDALKTLAENNTMSWYDHHAWAGSKKILELPIRFKIDVSKCATEIIQEDLFPNDDSFKRLASFANWSDFRTMRFKEVEKLYDVIASGYDRMALVDLFVNGIFWNEALEERYRKYAAIKRVGFAYLDEHSKKLKIDGITVIVGYSKFNLGIGVAAERLKTKGTDIAVYVGKNGRMSFRKNNPSVDLIALAEVFSGGGRENASGGFFGSEVKEEELAAAYEKIIGKLKGHFQKF